MLFVALVRLLAFSAAGFLVGLLIAATHEKLRRPPKWVRDAMKDADREAKLLQDPEARLVWLRRKGFVAVRVTHADYPNATSI